MEKDDEVKGQGNSYTTQFRQYDPRIGRWLSTDPVTHPEYSPYSAYDNNPIYYQDPSGANSEDGENGEGGEESKPKRNTNDRHLFNKQHFFGKKAGNSIVIDPKYQSAEVLDNLYDEAYKKLGQQNKIAGNVMLSNGQTWFVDRNSGKFYPVKGNGIINLTAKEVNMLANLKQNFIKYDTETAMDNFEKAVKNDPQFDFSKSLSGDFQKAFIKLGEKRGVSSGKLLSRFGGYMKDVTHGVSLTMRTSAYVEFGGSSKFVKWGGRTLLIVGLYADAWEVYKSEKKMETITKKVWSWAGATMGATYGASLSWETGPGVIVGTLGGGIAGYFIGETIYETITTYVFKPLLDE